MKEELIAKLKSSNRLPSPPGVAVRVLELSRSDDTTVEDLERVISSDPALASKILKFVNSPAGGLGHSTASLEEAINHLGFRGVQLMALSFSLVSSGKREGGAHFRVERFWSMSLACAVTARYLAKTVGRLDPNEAFINGLLFHIGQLALAASFPQSYDEVLWASSKDPSQLLNTETSAFGSNHLEVSAWLLRHWNLPESIWSTIAGAADAGILSITQSRLSQSQLLALSNITCQLFSDSKQERAGKPSEVLRLMKEHLEIDEEVWTQHYQSIVSEWKSYGELLSVQAGTEFSFADLQAEAAEAITHISIATQRESAEIRQRNQELQQKARIDGLTGLDNRASFDERFRAELDRARRTQRPIVLFMLDIDHFKKINDVYGHQVGDRVLQQVATKLREGIRKMDFVARYGGEEFAVIAPECNPEDARVLADRLRNGVKSSSVSHEGKKITVSLSIGASCATWPKFPKVDADLLHEADQQLYAAKNAGRDCFRMTIPSAQQKAA